MATKLILDSTCDVNAEMKDSFDFEVIPLSVIINDQVFLDGKDIELETVYDHMRQGIVPQTSQISFESIATVLEKCIAAKEDIIYLSFSSKLSGTYNVARQVIADYQAKHPERKIALVDSEGGSAGSGLIALQALKMIEMGFSFEEVLDQMKWNVKHVQYKFTLTNMNWLVKGGRINKATGYAGTALSIKPYLIVKDGQMIVHKLVRGQKKVYKQLIKDVSEGVGTFTDQTIGISHADDADRDRSISCRRTEEDDSWM